MLYVARDYDKLLVLESTLQSVACMQRKPIAMVSGGRNGYTIWLNSIFLDFVADSMVYGIPASVCV